MRHLTACICMLILLGSASGQTKQSPTRPTPAVVIAPVGSGAKLDPVSLEFWQHEVDKVLIQGIFARNVTQDEVVQRVRSVWPKISISWLGARMGKSLGQG